MGIQGLLPFLKDATEAINIRKYKGHTVAVDTYCWIHRGAVACALQLAKGDKCDQYVRYCLKFVNMLRSMGVTPILVFDGRRLPAKKSVEDSRRKRRELYSQKGKQLLREGKTSEARDAFVKCINVTSDMALEVMKGARSLGVDCIVAPYEADSQLAYLEKNGFVQAIITEDSDLLAFGCKRVIFKMDSAGNALEIVQSRLNRAVKMGTYFSVDKFRHMCIMAGCDYLPSLQGIGLGKARKFMHTSTNPDMRQVLKRIPLQLKLKVPVTQEYIDGFIQADNTFLYQLAFDPHERKLMPLNPYPPELADEEMGYAGRYFDSKLALQLSLGNIDAASLRKLFSFEPDTNEPFPKDAPRHKLSIWHQDYQPANTLQTTDSMDVTRNPTKGQEMTVTSNGVARRRSSPRKRARDQRDSNQDGISTTALAVMYGGSPDSKIRNVDISEVLIVPETPSSRLKSEISPLQEIEALPQRNSRMTPRNVFAVKKSHRVDRETRATLLQSEVTVSSRFFQSSKSIADSEEESESTEVEEKDDLVAKDSGHIYEPGKMDRTAKDHGQDAVQSEVLDSIRNHQRKVRGATGRLCDKNVDRTGVLDSLQKFRHSEFYEEQVRIKRGNEERMQTTPPSCQRSVAGSTSRRGGGAFTWSSQRSKCGGVQKTLADSMKSLRTFHRKSNSQVMHWDKDGELKTGVATNSPESPSNSQYSDIKSSQVESESDFAESQSSTASLKGLSSQRSIGTCSIDRDGPTFSQVVGLRHEESSPPGMVFNNSDIELSPDDKELCDLLADIADEDEDGGSSEGSPGDSESANKTNSNSVADDSISLIEVLDESPRKSSSKIQGTPALPSLGVCGRKRQRSSSNDENSPPLDTDRNRNEKVVSSYFAKGTKSSSKSKSSCKTPGLSKRRKISKKTPSSHQQPTLMAFIKKKTSNSGSSDAESSERKMPLSPSKMEANQNITPEIDSVCILNKVVAVRKAIFQ